MDSFRVFIDKLGGPRRAMAAGIGLFVALLILGVTYVAQSPDWVPAFSNQPMETVSQITEKLTAAAIPYKLDNGGSTVLVATGDVAKARVTLAKDGLPSAGRPGMELFDQPSWGMTDFTQRINYRRALEGELERTIGKMRGVDAAQVHLALHEESNFRQTDSPEAASIVLKLTNGQEPPADVVEGVQHLVSSSVDGMDATRVTVLDESGRLLSNNAESGSFAALTQSQMKTQSEVEKYLTNKAQNIVGSVVGGDNARVQVAALINFDKIDRVSQTVDPEKQAIATEQKYEITPGAQGGAASNNVASSFDNSKTTEQFSGAVGNLKRLTVAVLVNDRMVPPAKAGGTATYVPRTAAELSNIKQLVSAAVGVDSTRGDMVSVVDSHFDGVKAPEVVAVSAWDRVHQYQGGATLMVSVIIIGMVGLYAMRALTKPSVTVERESSALTGLPMPQLDTLIGTGDSSFELPSLEAPMALPRNDTRHKVSTLVKLNPELSSRVVRAWLKDD